MDGFLTRYRSVTPTTSSNGGANSPNEGQIHLIPAVKLINKTSKISYLYDFSFLWPDWHGVCSIGE